jgi:plasmid stabilization system protein ParE
MSFAVKKPRIIEEDELAAALWYDDQQPGLGDAFLDDVELVVSDLAENALLYSIRFADVRCARLPRFRKYGVFYVIRGSEVWLLAIFHGSRDPQWLWDRTGHAG